MASIFKYKQIEIQIQIQIQKKTVEETAACAARLATLVAVKPTLWAISWHAKAA